MELLCRNQIRLESWQVQQLRSPHRSSPIGISVQDILALQLMKKKNEKKIQWYVDKHDTRGGVFDLTWAGKLDRNVYLSVKKKFPSEAIQTMSNNNGGETIVIKKPFIFFKCCPPLIST